MVAEASSAMGDQEWRDLGMDDLFAEIDRTCGAVGQQALYHRMRSPARSPDQFHALGDFESIVRRLSDDVRSRERAQQILLRLDDSAVYALPRLFLGQPLRLRFAWIFPPLGLAAIAALVAALAGVPHGWAIVLLLLGVNYASRSLVSVDLAWIAQPVRALHTMLGAAAALSGTDNLLGHIDGPRARTSRLRRLTTLTSLAEGGGDDVLRVFVDYFNLIFLIDINVYLIALRECEKRSADLVSIFGAIGDVDAAQAVASFRAGRSDWCRPVILPVGRGIAADNLSHPLVPDAKPNSLSISAGRGVVITGSNMSGKTTFLRAVGVNVVLAQTINTCIATRFACPPLVLNSAIALTDNLLGGQSYYLAEASNVVRMVSADDSVQHLFLLDELFRGTNTIERIAAGVAAMESLLGTTNIAMVATHDLEVARMANGYDPWHFAELVTADGFTFDYVLRPGPATQRNAVALLGVLGAPSALIERATELCAALDMSTAKPASYRRT